MATANNPLLLVQMHRQLRAAENLWLLVMVRVQRQLMA